MNMKKNVIIAIKTSFGEESFFLEIETEHSIQYQIDIALLKVGYCDAFELISHEEVEEDYIKERKALISEYEKKYEPIEEAFPCGNMVTLKALRDDIEWRKQKA